MDMDIRMDMKKWIGSVIGSPEKRPLPVLSFPGIQMIGASVRDLVHSGELQARCMQAIAARYPALAAVSNMDLSVEAEAFGAAACFSDGEVPSITGVLIDTAEDAARLAVPPVGAGRTGECVEGIRLAVQAIRDRPVLAGVIGPFSLAGRLMDMTGIMYKAVDEPETVHLVLRKATRFLIQYIEAFKRAGAHGIVMAEPAAGLLSPVWNEDFSAAYVREIVARVQDDRFIVMYHNCGRTVPLLPAIVATGARAFHFGNAVDLADVIRHVPADRLVLGNIDPATQIARGTPESITDAVHGLRHKMHGHANFVLSSGCDIPPQTPLANIDAFFAASLAAVLPSTVSLDISLPAGRRVQSGRRP